MDQYIAYAVLAFALLMICAIYVIIISTAVKAPAISRSEMEWKTLIASYGILESSSTVSTVQDGSSEEQQEKPQGEAAGVCKDS